MLSCMKPVAVELSVFMGLGGCRWYNVCKRVLIKMPSRALWKIPSTSVSLAEDNTCCNVFHSTKIVPLSFRYLVMVGLSDRW